MMNGSKNRPFWGEISRERSIYLFLLLLWPLIFGMPRVAFGVQWGTTPSKHNILFVDINPSHSLTQLDARLVKAMKAGEILILESTSILTEMEKQISDFYHQTGKPILALNDTMPSNETKVSQAWVDGLQKLIHEYKGKKIVVVLKTEHYQGDQGLIKLLKNKRITFTPFASIPLWPVYVPSHHWSPPPQRSHKPLPAPDMSRLAPILPRPMPEIPRTPPPEISKQPMGGRNSPFYRHYFPERSGR